MSDSESDLDNFNLPPTPRPSNINPNTVTMTDNTTPTATQSPIINLNRLINLPNAVRPFKGTIGSEYIEPKVRQWVESLEEYFDREGISDDVTKIREAKRFVHPTEGSAIEVITYTPTLKAATVWAEFSKIIQVIFKETNVSQPLITMDQLYHLKWDGTEDINTFIAKIHKLTSEGCRALEETFKIKFSAEQEKALSAVTLFHNLPEAHKKKFQETVNDKHSLHEVMNIVKTKCGEIVPKKSKELHVQAVQKVPQYNNSRPQYSKPPVRSPPVHYDMPPKVECFKCHKSGHLARECPFAYCNQCREKGHREGSGPRCSIPWKPQYPQYPMKQLNPSYNKPQISREQSQPQYNRHPPPHTKHPNYPQRMSHPPNKSPNMAYRYNQYGKLVRFIEIEDEEPPAYPPADPAGNAYGNERPESQESEDSVVNPFLYPEAPEQYHK